MNTKDIRNNLIKWKNNYDESGNCYVKVHWRAYTVDNLIHTEIYDLKVMSQRSDIDHIGLKGQDSIDEENVRKIIDSALSDLIKYQKYQKYQKLDKFYFTLLDMEIIQEHNNFDDADYDIDYISNVLIHKTIADNEKATEIICDGYSSHTIARDAWRTEYNL